MNVFKNNMPRADLYVAPYGDDTALGLKDCPVATPSRAAKLARSRQGHVVICVRAGVYFMQEPLRLTAEDSNTTWIADGKVVFTGAKHMSGLKFEEYKGGIMVADVGTNLAIDQVFVDGVQQIMARYPNYTERTILNGVTTKDDIRQRSKRWANPKGGFIRALHINRWGGNSFIIDGPGDTDFGVAYSWAGDNNCGPDIAPDTVMVENIFEELDAPKEWFYDSKTGKLYIMPEKGKKLDENTRIECAVTAELIHIEGDHEAVRNIVFDGFTLENTMRTMFTKRYVPVFRSDWCIVRSAALFMQNAENITFRNGFIHRIGGNAVFLSGHCDNITITHNRIYDIGSSGVIAAGLPTSCYEPSFFEPEGYLKPEAEPYFINKQTVEIDKKGPKAEFYVKNCEISYNHIKNVGVWEKQSSHVTISIALFIKVVHNTLNVGPRSGINVSEGSFGGHELAYNDIFDVQLETYDHGMFNSWGRDRFWSIKGFGFEGYNGLDKEPYLDYDCIERISIHDNRMHFGGQYEGGFTFGIDLDDGSSNYDIYNNLCLNMGIKCREGFRRNVFNNIVLNSQFNIHCHYDNAYDRYHHNLVISKVPYNTSCYDEAMFNRWFHDSHDQVDHNWYYYFGAAIRLPKFWDECGFEEGTISDTEDPCFADPAANDYTVMNLEAAKKVGFVNFPMDQFGVPGCCDVCPIFDINELNVLSGDAMDSIEMLEWQKAVLRPLDDAAASIAGAGSTDGALIDSIDGDSCLIGYGLKAHDVVQEINGIKIVKMPELASIYDAFPIGGDILLSIVRNQAHMEVKFVKKQ